MSAGNPGTGQGSGQSKFVFHRPDYARYLADTLVGHGFEDHTSGLFLAAPRRTGKSTFLRHDLKPAMESAGTRVVLVDLWEKRDQDPVSLVWSALREAIRDTQAGFNQGLRRSGVSSYGIGKLATVDLDRMGMPENPTLTSMLRVLVKACRKPVCLIIDEAQHMLTTPTGLSMTYDLKAARDALNQEPSLEDTRWDGRNLILVCTGSHQDKLAHLVLSRDAAFYGGHVTSFPLLDTSYVQAYASWLKERMGPGSAARPTLEGDELERAFQLLWRRPEKLYQAVGRFVGVGGTLLDNVASIRAQTWEELQGEYDALQPLEQAVFLRLLRQGSRFSPFSVESMADYSRMAGRRVDQNAAVGALERLREAKLVWRSARGTYVLENQDFSEWYEDTSPAEPAVRTKSDDTMSVSDAIEGMIEHGMSIKSLAECLSVEWRTVKRWRDPMSTGPQERAMHDRVLSMYTVLCRQGSPPWSQMTRDGFLMAMLKASSPDWDGIARRLDTALGARP